MKSREERQAGSEARGQQRRTRRPRARAHANPKAARRAFRQRYPDVAVDPALFRLVGVDPPLTLNAEKAALHEAVADRFASR